MARQNQSHSRDINKPSTSRKKGDKGKEQKRSKKAKKEKVLSVGFVWSSLILAIVFFFVSLIIGMELGPNLPF